GHNFPGSEWYEDSFYLIQGGPPDKSTPENPWYIFW
ncbi:MAG: hypothetical protein CFH06_01391, partial [Alphaproteobacteria bacterium MarineAlpha3_Bin5]